VTRRPGDLCIHHEVNRKTGCRHRTFTFQSGGFRRTQVCSSPAALKGFTFLVKMSVVGRPFDDEIVAEPEYLVDQTIVLVAIGTIGASPA
jgi:hypothetical protein